MTALGHRRIVTGLNAMGKSTVIIDGPIPHLNNVNAALAWRTAAIPADNSGTEDVVVPYDVAMLHTSGSNFAICEFRPNAPTRLHATDTIDYIVILSDRVTLIVEDGETDLGPEDFVIDRGVVHAWRNLHDEPCIAAVVNLPAHPVGKGRTI
jgi:quercetin dioxygenase-like cupin family protein